MVTSTYLAIIKPEGKARPEYVCKRGCGNLYTKGFLKKDFNNWKRDIYNFVFSAIIAAGERK
jgi:hypothetical protein